MELRGRQVLVTGVSGTVGSALAARFAWEGMRVRGLVRRPGPLYDLDSAGVELVQGDVTDYESVRRAMQGVQIVAHAAAHIGNRVTDWEEARAVNVEGTRNVTRAALEANVERFVHFSTFGVYDGRGRTEVDETTPLWDQVDRAYTQTKVEGERVVQEAARQGLPVTILRPGAVFGNHPSSFAGPLMVEYVRSGNWLGYHPQDLLAWTHVENLAEMTVVVLRSPDAIGEAYTAVDGPYRVEQHLGAIASWLGVERPAPPEREPFDRTYLFGKIRSLGYLPLITFDEALRELEQYTKSTLQAGGHGLSAVRSAALDPSA